MAQGIGGVGPRVEQGWVWQGQEVGQQQRQQGQQPSTCSRRLLVLLTWCTCFHGSLLVRSAKHQGTHPVCPFPFTSAHHRASRQTHKSPEGAAATCIAWLIDPQPARKHLVHVLPQPVVVVKGAAAEGAVRVCAGAVLLQRLEAGVGLQLQGEQAALLRGSTVVRRQEKVRCGLGRTVG